MYKCIYIHVYVCSVIYVYVYIYIHTYMYIYIYVSVIYTHIYVCAYIDICIYIYIYQISRWYLEVRSAFLGRLLRSRDPGIFSYSKHINSFMALPSAQDRSEDGNESVSLERSETYPSDKL